jgi:hypothetical protein
MRDHLARLAYLVSVIASLAAIGFVLGRFG